MMIRKLLYCLIVLGLLAVSCTGTQTTTRGEPLRVPYTNWPADYISILARELGYFNQYGVSVSLVYYPDRSNVLIDLATEKLDGANIPTISLLPLIRNDNYRIVAVADSSEGADQIVAQAGIRTPAELSGQRIGVSIGSAGEFLVHEMLRNAGIKIDEVTLVDIDPQAVPVAIPDLIAAGHTAEPYTATALGLGQHVIYSSADIPGLLTDVLAFRLDVVQQRPEDVRAFVRAWLEAAEWWLENPVQGNQIISTLADIDLETITTDEIHIFTLEENRSSFAQNPGTNSSSIYFVLRSNLSFVIDSGILTLPPDTNLLIDPSFLP